MSVSIQPSTSGAAALTPTVVQAYEWTRQSGNRVHVIPGASFPDVTTRVAGPRAGSLVLVFPLWTDAVAAELAHSGAATFTLTDTNSPAVNMTYVVGDGGSVRLAPDNDGTAWLLTVDFVQIA